MTKHRPTITEGEHIGMARYNLYKDTLDHYRLSLKDGYYLECITLMESLIKDRLESLYNELNAKEDSSDVSLCCITSVLNEIPNSLDVIKELDEWRKKRNNAIHGMAKLQDVTTSFSNRYESLCIVAKNGYDVFRKVDTLIKNYRKNMYK